MFLCMLMLNGRDKQCIVENVSNSMVHFNFTFVYHIVRFRVILVLEVINLTF